MDGEQTDGHRSGLWLWASGHTPFLGMGSSPLLSAASSRFEVLGNPDFLFSSQ